jgi:hypothetical protein
MRTQSFIFWSAFLRFEQYIFFMGEHRFGQCPSFEFLATPPASWLSLGRAKQKNFSCECAQKARRRIGTASAPSFLRLPVPVGLAVLSKFPKCFKLRAHKKLGQRIALKCSSHPNSPLCRAKRWLDIRRR